MSHISRVRIWVYIIRKKHWRKDLPLWGYLYLSTEFKWDSNLDCLLILLPTTGYLNLSPWPSGWKNHCPEHPFLEVSELPRQTAGFTPGTTGIMSSCLQSGWFASASHWGAGLGLARGWRLLLGQLLSLEGSPGSTYLGLYQVVMFLLPSTTFLRLWKSFLPVKAFSPGIGLPTRLALPGLRHPRSSRDCAACCIENHHLGPASHQHSIPGQLSTAHISQVQTKIQD